MPKKVLTYKAGGKLESAEQTFFKSPYYLSSYDFPYNPDNLCSANNYDIYDEMRHDDQVKAAISMKKDMVIGSGWQIKTENEELKEFIEGNLKNLNNDGLESSFEEVLRDILTAYEYGFSLSEVVYALGEDNLYRIKTIKVRPPHSFKFELDDKGNVVQVKQSTNKGADLSFNPDLFLHFAYQMEFGNPYGVSDLKAAFTPWKIKKYALRFYAKYLERFVSPVVHGAYDSAGGATDSGALYDILKTIQNSTVLVTPDNVKVEFIQPDKGGADIYEKAINQLDMKIARAILMPDLLGMSGDKTAGGAYALGEKQFQLFLGTIKKERELLAKKITQKVIRPLVQSNWGDEEVEFCFMPYSHGDETQLAELWIKAVATGKFEPSDDEINQIRRITKFPEGEVERPLAPAPFGSEQKPKEGAVEGADGAPDSEDSGDDEEVRENSECCHHYRELTSFEKKVNFKEIKDTLDKSENRAIPKIRKAANKIATSILDQIKDKKILANFKPEAINAIKPKFMREMNIIFRDHFQDLFESSIKQAKGEIFPDKKFVDSEILPDEFLDIIEADSFKAVGDYSNDVLKRAQNILAQGLKNGVSSAEIHKAIQDELEGFTDRWVNTVVRTKTTEVYNSARKLYWETDPLAKQIITGYMYSAIIDDRTSEVCRHLDGKMFEKGDFTNRTTPPVHFNCRSLWVPITKFEDTEFDEPESIGKLQDMGGNLIYQEQVTPTGILQPNIVVGGDTSRAGDKIVIAPSGPMTFVKILSCSVSNTDHEYPVVVGFRSDYYAPMWYETMLNKMGGIWEKQFPDGWLLGENKGLMLNLSANAKVTYTFEYVIVDVNGVRVR